MSSRPAAGAAGVVFAATVLLSVASLALELSRPGSGLQGFATIALIPMTLVFGATGALLAARVPGNAIGWLFCVFALVGTFGLAADSYVTFGPPKAFGDLPGSVWLAWAALLLSDTLAPALIATTFLLFPTGTLPSRRWRLVAWILLLATAAAVGATAFVPGPMQGYVVANPLGVAGRGEVLGQVADGLLQVIVVPLMLLAMLSLFARRRSAGPVERAQLKWFALAAGFLVSVLVFKAIAEPLLPGSRAGNVIGFLVFVVALLGIPVSMGIAILRYRLYDIDRIIGRTVVYGSLTGVLGLTYGLVVVVLQATLGREISEQPLAVAATTLIVAALFRPARARIQSIIDRRFNRSRYDAQRTVEAFGSRLRDEVDLETLTGDLLTVVRDTVQPAHASLWLRAQESVR